MLPLKLIVLLLFILKLGELVGMSGIFTLATIGLFLNSTSFKPGVEAFLLEFWNCLSFIGFLMVFTFIGLLIPAHTYLHISFSDVYYSLNIYFTLIVLRLLVFLLMSPILSRLGHGFSWRWAFIMVWSEMKGTPNINMALLLAYSDISLGSERERSQILFHGVSVCVITLIVNRFILPMAVTKLGLRDVTSTKYKSVYYTFQHFQELTKSTAMALKFDKDLANADWNMVDNAIILQNPYALNQEEITEHQKVKCPDCNKEIDETLNIEAMELTNRRLLSAQIASYQRQYRNEVLSQSAVQVLVGAAGSFGEKKGEYMSPENIKNFSESKKLLSFLRKLLLNWVYNTKKDKGVPSRPHAVTAAVSSVVQQLLDLKSFSYTPLPTVSDPSPMMSPWPHKGYMFLHACHRIVFTNEFEYTGYLVVLMSTYPMIICWISRLKDIYDNEIKCANYYFLAFYILEALLKVAAMRKEFFSHTWLLFELGITLVGILDIILIETDSISYNFDLTETVVFMNVIRLLRILRILKLVTPKLLQIIDKRMSQQISFRYSILKGYVQGEMDVLNIIDQIASSKQTKQILLKRVMRNMEHAMKELDSPREHEENDPEKGQLYDLIGNHNEQAVHTQRSCFEPNKKMDYKYQTCGPKPASRAQQCWASVSISLKAGLSIPFPEAQLKCECYPRKGMNLITTSEGLVTAGLPVECLPQGYLEYDHPEIAVTMKTKEEINVMLNMAREIVKTFRSKGIIHKVEGTEINKLIMAKKIQVLDLQSVIQPFNVEEAPCNIPWLSEDPEAITFIQEKAKVVTFDCGNNIFEEGDEPEGIYVIISGMVKLKRSKPHLEMERVSAESEIKIHPLPHTEYLLSGEIIGELNCLTKERMQYSATCKTVVETYFIPISHLYEGFEKRCPNMKHKMWQKIGLAITAQKIREHLSFEDWNYKLQLKLCNAFIRDIPKSMKTDIYDETVTHVVLIHGSAEDCQLRKIYKAPFLIPVTCHQIQGMEDFTKVMIIQTSIAVRKFRWNVRKYIPPRRISMKPDSERESFETLDETSEEDNGKKENQENEELIEENINI
ncbi:solute carrier family 9, isoform 10 [Mus musculus]|nr:solute carrier family 9, isoform 10 [Mus musculus]